MGFFGELLAEAAGVSLRTANSRYALEVGFGMVIVLESKEAW